MSSAKRRRISSNAKEDELTPVPECKNAPNKSATDVSETQSPVEDKEHDSLSTSKPTDTDRHERFKQLRLRAQKSTQNNLKETAAENKRLKTDPNLLTSLQRKAAIASHKLLKADTEAAGDDFERKRAWDWTVEESERWDRRMEKKERHRDNVAFHDYTQDAQKIYKRQLRDMAPDVEAYDRQKAEAVQKAAASGGLEIVEAEDGELIAVDRSGTFYANAETTNFMTNRPEKAAVDRLVKDLQKAEEVRLRKRRERGRQGDDDGDVTFINEKNKQFNQKLARFYNKYTTEIRDSFERGTMI